MESKITTQSGKNSLSPSSQNLKTLAGVVERITFQSTETGYTVARLFPDYSSHSHDSKSGNGNGSDSSGKPSNAAPFPPAQTAQRSFFKQAKGDDNLVTIVGTLTGVAPGEDLELSGVWQQHAQH